MVKAKPAVTVALSTTTAKATRAVPPKKIAGPRRAAAVKTAPIKPATPAAASEHTKVVRDGFTMPEADYGLLKSLKSQCLASGVEVKKSELLRAGVQALAALPAAELLKRMRALPTVKAGRKKK